MEQKSSLLNRAWRVLQENPTALLGAAESPYLALFAAAAIARAFIVRYANLPSTPTEPLELWRSMGPFAKIGIILAYFFYNSVPQSLAFAGVSVVTWENCLGGNTALLHGFSAVRRRFFPLIALSFLVGFVTTLLAAVFPLVGPFIIQTIFLPAAVVVLMLEKPRLGVLDALRTSLSLTANSLATIFGVGVVSVGAFAGLVVVLIRLRLSLNVPPVFFTFAVLVSFILVVPPAIALVLGVVVTLSYYDRRSVGSEVRISS